MSQAVSFEQQFDNYFQEFLASVFDQRITIKFDAQSITLDHFDEITEARLHRSTSDFVQSINISDNKPWTNTDDRTIAAGMAAASAAIEREGFRSYVNRRLHVAALPVNSTLSDRDFIYTKINHGFWEQLFALFSEEVDPVRMRIKDTAQFHKMYVDSGFILPLGFLIRRLAKSETESIGLENFWFGLSLGNGALEHGELVARFEFDTEFARLVHSGSAIGASAFLESQLGPSRFNAFEGGFPKLGLESGHLKKIIADRILISDQINFVVPPHLRGIRLAEANLSQKQYFVSGTVVHESWIATLYAIAKSVLGCLSKGQRPLIFTQCGVFSALLGLFLRVAKQDLGLNASSLTFFDLGQVLDIANPEGGGPWLRGFRPADESMFEIQLKSSTL